MKKILNTKLIAKLKDDLTDVIKRAKKVGRRLLFEKLNQQKRLVRAKPLSDHWEALMERFVVAGLQRGNDLDESRKNSFRVGSYTNFAGCLKYHLFIPSNYRAGMPLLVMLHGCNQDAEIFATGTRMNLHAEQLGFLVLYPAQSNLANVNKCWNWYKPINQYRNMGEPAVIAGMTQKIINKYKINSEKVYIAGLSAGAAMAYIVGSLYSDIYAAIGVHSGLLYRGINNMFSALAAMKTGSEKIGNIEELQVESDGDNTPQKTDQRGPQPLIIFHGDNDSVVHAQNAADLMAWHQQKNSFKKQHYNESSTPYSHTRTTYQNDKGEKLAEQWIIHGAGHAWSGGSAEGNFTDANGPDASREMVRFFMEKI